MTPTDRPLPRRWPKRTAAIVAGVAGLAFAVLGALYFRIEAPPAPTAKDTSVSAPVSRDFPLRIWSTPRALADFAFEDAGGRKVRLANFRGKVVLVNLWATWCTPCRREMPALDRLQATLGGADFQVLALSIERDGAAKVRAFFGETSVKSLGVYVDAEGEASAAVRSAAIPTSVLIGRDGREIGRLLGPAEWDSEAAIEFIRERIGGSKGR